MPALQTPDCEVNTPIPAFELQTPGGETFDLERVRGPRGTLVMFICNHCPFVKSTLARICDCARELEPLGIGSVAIMSNDVETYPADHPDRMAELAREADLPFPYLFDPTQSVARAFGAVCTPDFFGYNAAGLLQYRGRLDEGRLDPPSPDAPRELFDAMRLIAETGAGPAGQVASIGCSIKWRAA